MRILLTNDDGVYAPGIKILYNEFKKYGDVTVVAPLAEKSTTGHSLTLHKPLRILPVAEQVYGVTGSPADCVYLAIREILKGKPDLVISGINRGANLGQDVYYSGTVSAAREASIMGIPSMAVSLAVNYKKNLTEEEMNFKSAAKVAAKLLRNLGDIEIPPHTLLNVNVPDLPYSKIKGLKLGRQGFRVYSGEILKRKDHRGRDYFWVGGEYKGFRKEVGSDCTFVEKGYASLTPLQLDCTHYDLLARLSDQWQETLKL